MDLLKRLDYLEYHSGAITDKVRISSVWARSLRTGTAQTWNTRSMLFADGTGAKASLGRLS
jgi:hypothetical protein